MTAKRSGKAPLTRSEIMARVRGRDAETLDALAEAGWAALTVWECEMGDCDGLAARLRAFLGAVRAG